MELQLPVCGKARFLQDGDAEPDRSLPRPAVAVPCGGVSCGYAVLVVYLLLIGFVASGLVGIAARRVGWMARNDIEREQLLNRETFLLLPVPSRVLSGTFQRVLERAARNGLPFLPQFMPVLSEVQASLDSWVLKAFPHAPACPVGTKGVMLVDDRSRTMQVPRVCTEAEREKAAVMAESYNRLAQTFPDVRFTLCVIPRVSDWFVESEACSPKSRLLMVGIGQIKDFQQQLDASVRFLYWGEDRSPAEAIEGYYLTDHHLTTPALYEMYERLLAVLGGEHDLGPPVKNLQWFEVAGVDFLGRSARESGGYSKVQDKLVDGQFILPSLAVTIHDAESEKRNLKSAYQAGEVPPGKLVHHYTEYFGHDYGVIQYDNSTSPAERSLLVVGDSHDNPIEPLLASHFRVSLFVHPGVYKRSFDQEFPFAEFAREQGVSDVVIFGSFDTLFELLDIIAERSEGRTRTD